MQEDYPQEKLQELYELLPEDLKKALFSQEVTDMISDICAEENLEEKQADKVSKYIGYVLLGLLSPNDFEKTLKERLFFSNDLTARVATQVLRHVFIPVKVSLELIYKTQLKLPPGFKEEKAPAKKEEQPQKRVFVKKEKKDVYREPVE